VSDVAARLVLFAALVRIDYRQEMVYGHVGVKRLDFQRLGYVLPRFFRDYAELLPVVIPQQGYNRFGNLQDILKQHELNRFWLSNIMLHGILYTILLL